MRRLLIFLVFAAPAALAQAPPDTLRHLAPEAALVVHEYDQATFSGLIFGHNSRGTEEYAEKYHVVGGGQLLGMVAHLTGAIAHPNHIAEFNAYRVGANRLPDVRIASKQAFYGDLDLSGGPILVPFNAGVAVADSFFISFNVGDYSHGGYEGDDLAVLAGPDGARDEADLAQFGRNVVRLHNHLIRDWADFYTQNFTPIATHLALFPIVELANSTAGEDRPGLVSMDLTLRPAYPSPARGSVTVAFELATATDDIRIELYDARGRLVRSAVLGARNSGAHTHVLNLDGLAPGTYVYGVAADADRLYSTLILVR